MEQELFNPQSSSVSSSRIIYIQSTSARTSLLHLQKDGSLRALHPHTSKRSDLVSFRCFVALSGEGEIFYEGQNYQLGAGDCVDNYYNSVYIMVSLLLDLYIIVLNTIRESICKH